MIYKVFVFIALSIFSLNSFSADPVDLSSSEVMSEIEYKNDSLTDDFGKLIDVALVLSLLLIVLIVALYFLKPIIIKSNLQNNIESERIKINEIKHMPHNVVLYLLDVDKRSVLLIKNGSNVSALKLDLSPDYINSKKT